MIHPRSSVLFHNGCLSPCGVGWKTSWTSSGCSGAPCLVSVVSEVRADRLEARGTPSPGTFFLGIRNARNAIMGGLLAFTVPRPHDAVWSRILGRKRCCNEAGACSVQNFGRRIRAFGRARRKSQMRAEAACTKEIWRLAKPEAQRSRCVLFRGGAAGSIGVYLRLRTALKSSHRRGTFHAHADRRMVDGASERWWARGG